MVYIEDYQGDDPYISDAVQMITDMEDIAYNVVYLVKTSYVHKADEIVVVIPYVYGNVGDVPTAGAALWNYTVGIQVTAWSGNERNIEKNVLVKDPSVSIFADPNTALDKASSSYCKNIQEKSLELDGHIIQYYIERPAITKDSTIGKNAACKNTICWEGNLLVHHFLRPSISIDFSITAEYPYNNNVV